MTKNVLVLTFNPFLEQQNKTLVTYANWNDPSNQSKKFANDVFLYSYGIVNYTIVQEIEIDGYPTKSDGFIYNDSTYLACRDSGGSQCYSPDIIDYNLLLSTYQICEKRNNGEIDELWIWGGPWFGYWESALAGPEAFWYNSPPITGSTCTKLLPIMGFNYERGEAEMFEDLAHRTESTMWHVYGSWGQNENHAWNRFTLLDINVPGRSGCGNAHSGPNGNGGYDRENTRIVLSSCEDFLHYPNMTGTFTNTSCVNWGCTTLGYFYWWFSHVPHSPGTGQDGKLNNWWKYVVDYDNV